MTNYEIELELHKMCDRARINHPYHEVNTILGVRVSCEMFGRAARWRIIDLEDFSSFAIARKRLATFIQENAA